MKEQLNRLKDGLSIVSIQGEDQILHAQITDDLRGLKLKDVPNERMQILLDSRDDCVLVCRNAFNAHTIVTAPMRSYGLGDLVAPIKYTLGGYFDNLQNSELSKISVVTPYAGRLEPRIEAQSKNESWEAIVSGKPVEVSSQYAKTLTHGDWSNGVNLRVGSGGLMFEGMTTTIPVAGLRGMAGFGEVRNKVHSLRVLLTLLNGGRAVEVDKVHIRLDEKCKHPHTVEMSFLFRAFDVLSYGLGDRYYKSRLTVPHALFLIGMRGVESWFEWCDAFENRHLLDFWLHSDRSIAALMALEGLGRRLKRRDGYRGNVHFKAACEAVLQEFGLSSVLNNRDIQDLNRANVKLVKHIGDVSADVHKKHQRILELGATLADFVVGYGILRGALGKLPKEIDDAWREEIVSAGEVHRKAKTDVVQ